jgi:hypothetical protein
MYPCLGLTWALTPENANINEMVIVSILFIVIITLLLSIKYGKKRK